MKPGAHVVMEKKDAGILVNIIGFLVCELGVKMACPIFPPLPGPLQKFYSGIQ